MGKVDGPSKRLDQKVGVENNNNNQTLIKEQWIYSLTEVVIEGPEVEILEKIKNSQKKGKKSSQSSRGDEKDRSKSIARR